MNQIPVHFYIVIAVLLFNGIAWVVKQLKKQKALRDAQMAEQRRQTEMIRTGRPLPLPAKPKLETLAERQERLRQLREDAPPAPAPAPQPQAKPITRELWPGGPVVVVGQAGAPAMPVARPMPIPQPRRPQAQPAAQAFPFLRTKSKNPQPAPAATVARAVPASARSVATAEGSQEHTVERYRMGQGIGIDRPDPALSPAALVPRTALDWRRAFIASEILRAPVSLRTPEPGQLHV